MRLSLILPAILGSSALALAARATPPLVTLRNGTLAGTHNAAYAQDFFLGIPFAEPPTGNLRLRRPAPAAAWHGTTRIAYDYGPWCQGNSLPIPGTGQRRVGAMSEDCLHLNVVRPSGPAPPAGLPVLVWIHGGAFKDGSAVDGRYNGSFIVRASAEMGTPLIFVSINYRLGVFGMMQGSAIRESGSTNLLLHDQRQALAWIQENIGSFGGDPARVTIAGESAGASSVGFHLLAHGGRDDGLFSGAIAQSGGPFTTTLFYSDDEQEAQFNIVLNITGCAGADDALRCLRAAPAEALQKASLAVPYAFTMDGDLIPDQSSRLMRTGNFVKVPLLIGTNRNEGTSVLQFAMPGPINAYEDFAGIVAAFNNGKPPPEHVVQKWLRLYQEEIADPSPAGLGTVLANPGPQLGAEYGAASLWLGDAFYAADRRFTNQVWDDHGVPSFSYFFDTVTANVDAETLGVTHFQDIPFMFGNKGGFGWETDPLPAEPETRMKFEKLADVMSRMWISFVVSGSPNHHQVADVNATWPVYSQKNPLNLVFSATEGVSLQPDTWREEALQLFVDMAVGLED